MSKLSRFLLVFSLIAPGAVVSCTDPNLEQITIKNNPKNDDSSQNNQPIIDNTKSNNDNSNDNSDALPDTNSISEQPSVETNPVSNTEVKTTNYQFNPIQASRNTFLTKNDDYIQSIKYRTFSLKWYMQQKGTTQGYSVSGTLWMLDYMHLGNNKFKFYFGTNYHVASNLFSAKDYDIYQQPNRLKTFNPYYYEFAWASDAYDTNSKVGDSNWNRVQIPFNSKNLILRNFFLAHNFLQLNALPNLKSTYFADFAIVEFEIDLDALSKSDYKAKAFRVKLAQAMNEVNKSIKKFTNLDQTNSNKYLFTDNKIPYATLDYASVLDTYEKSKTNSSEQISEIVKEKLATYNYSLVPRYLYSFGYPAPSENNDSGIFNTIDANERNTLGYSSDDPSLGFSIQKDYVLKNYDQNSYFNNEVATKFYAFMYSFNSKNSPDKGASGSLVLNEQGLPIGLLLGHLSNPVTYIDANKNFQEASRALIQPFVQSIPLYSQNNQITIPAFNLLDHTNSELYPQQLVSYRSRINDVYGKDAKTAVFGGEIVTLL